VYLFHFEDEAIELLLEFLVGIVNKTLFQRVVIEHFEPKNIQHADEAEEQKSEPVQKNKTQHTHTHAHTSHISVYAKPCNLVCLRNQLLINCVDNLQKKMLNQGQPKT